MGCGAQPALARASAARAAGYCSGFVFDALSPGLPAAAGPLQQNIAQMSRMLPPHMLKMMGGPAAIQSLIKQMEGKF